MKAKTPTVLLELRGSLRLDDYIVDLCWSPDARQLVAAGGEGKLFLAQFDADLRTREALAAREVGQHGLGTLAVAWQPRGDAFVSSGQDGRIVWWDGASGEMRVEQRPSRAWTTQLAFAADGTLASAAGKQVYLWQAGLELAHEFAPLDATVASLCWDKPGRDLAVAKNGGLAVYRVEPPRHTVRQYRWAAPCLVASFSPNGRYLATGTQDGSVHFWHLASGKDSQMRGYPAKVDTLSWSSDGRWLASAAGDVLVLWDFGGKGPEGSRPLQLAGHTDRIECLAFQPGGPFLVSGGRDWRLSLWLPGKATTAIDAHLTDSEPSCLRWSADGRFVAVGERSGALSIYELVRLP